MRSTRLKETSAKATSGLKEYLESLPAYNPGKPNKLKSICWHLGLKDYPTDALNKASLQMAASIFKLVSDRELVETDAQESYRAAMYATTCSIIDTWDYCLVKLFAFNDNELTIDFVSEASLDIYGRAFDIDSDFVSELIELAEELCGPIPL